MYLAYTQHHNTPTQHYIHTTHTTPHTHTSKKQKAGDQEGDVLEPHQEYIYISNNHKHDSYSPSSQIRVGCMQMWAINDILWHTAL